MNRLEKHSIYANWPYFDLDFCRMMETTYCWFTRDPGGRKRVISYMRTLDEFADTDIKYSFRALVNFTV